MMHTPNEVTILLTMIALGLLIVFCAEHDAAMRRAGWGVSAIGAVALVITLLGG